MMSILFSVIVMFAYSFLIRGEGNRAYRENNFAHHIKIGAKLLIVMGGAIFIGTFLFSEPLYSASEGLSPQGHIAFNFMGIGAFAYVVSWFFEKKQESQPPTLFRSTNPTVPAFLIKYANWLAFLMILAAICVEGKNLKAALLFCIIPFTLLVYFDLIKRGEARKLATQAQYISITNQDSLNVGGKYIVPFEKIASVKYLRDIYALGLVGGVATYKYMRIYAIQLSEWSHFPEDRIIYMVHGGRCFFSKSEEIDDGKLANFIMEQAQAKKGSF